MRTLKTLTSVAAAASLAMSGVAYAEGAHSVNMLPTSSYAERSAAPALGASQVQDDAGVSAWIIALLAGAAVIGGILLAAGGDGDVDGDTPG